MVKGLVHVGMSVRSLERSIAFYRDLLGMRVLIHKPFAGERYDAIMNLKGAAGSLAVLQGNNIELELFEFSHPAATAQALDRPVCDHGITHICLEVDDIAGTYARLTAAGISFHCPPIVFGDAKVTETATYGRDPDGNVFELLELRKTG